MDNLEAFFNHYSDAFWAWPPLHRLRPRSEEAISAGKFLSLLPLIVFFALALIVLLFALGGAADAFSSGTLLTRTGGLTFLHNLHVIFTMIGLRIVFLTVFVSYGLSLLTLPSLLFWNRRARRLHRAPPPSLAMPDVWPPPPNVPGPGR